MARAKNYLMRSIVISVSWHLLWLSAVNVSLNATPYEPLTYTKVSFLGPILEKTAFEMMAEESRPRAETLYRSPVIIRHEAELEARGPGHDVSGMAEYAAGAQVTGAGIQAAKSDPNSFIRGTEMYYHIGERGLRRFIEGPARERAVLYKPELPSFADASSIEREHVRLRLRFVLSHDGAVERVEPLTLSGDPAMDMRARAYLRQWRFEPRYADEGSEKDWGIVTVDIRPE